MDTAVRKLIDELIRQQKLMGYTTDEAFAEWLGVSRALWNLTRRAELTPNVTLLSAVLNRLPGLEPEVVAVLKCLHTQPRKNGAKQPAAVA